jgi:hypothetical protein
MNYRSNPTASTIRRTSMWLEIATNAYLDHRHRIWVLAEELGDVVFVADRAVVLVHRERAEHIARALSHGAAVGLLDDIVAMPVSARPTRSPASSDRASGDDRGVDPHPLAHRVRLPRHPGRGGGVRGLTGGAA